MALPNSTRPAIVVRHYESYYWNGIGNEAYSTVTDGYAEYKIVGDVRGSDGFFVFRNGRLVPDDDISQWVVSRTHAVEWCRCQIGMSWKRPVTL